MPENHYANRPPRTPPPLNEANADLDIDREVRLHLYRRLQELRQVGDRLHRLFLENLVRGTSHLSLGMEAVSAGFGAAMRDDDYSLASYRGHAHTLSRGASMEGVIAELLGRDNGLMRGKGGSMHLVDVNNGMLGSYGIVGSHLPIANGAAWSAQLRGSDQVTVCFFGDGGTNIGAFHEALNLAAVWKLPVVFVCENNLYKEYTTIDLVTDVEHPSVIEPASLLEKAGMGVVRVPVDPKGLLAPDALLAAVAPDTRLVSLVWANNETGGVQPMEEIALALKARGIPLHVDATQAVGKWPIDLGRVPVDYLSCSAHKLNGPKGTGCLVAREGSPLQPLISGGPQERRMRGGTENVAGIVGFGEACALATAELDSRITDYASLRDRLWEGLQANAGAVRRNGCCLLYTSDAADE